MCPDGVDDARFHPTVLDDEAHMIRGCVRRGRPTEVRILGAPDAGERQSRQGHGKHCGRNAPPPPKSHSDRLAGRADGCATLAG